MPHSLHDIARIIHAGSVPGEDILVEHLLWDSRKVYSPVSSLFFALKGPRRDGHQFINELYKKGVRYFVVMDLPDQAYYPEAIFLVVNDTLRALQLLAIYHRNQFNIPVIGITGSNGKTIVKEWLYQLLQEDYHIVRSPKSYNSQIGVPLSVWGMDSSHTLAIFEAGISRPGEMEKLQNIIQPTIGILTNIGEAHSDGFESKRDKLLEKLKLFDNTSILIHTSDDELIDTTIKSLGIKNFSWGTHVDSNLRVLLIKKENDHTSITFHYKGENSELIIPFTDDASIQNSLTCCCLMLHLGKDISTISRRMTHLQSVNMRLEFKKGINHCALINDSYSADLSSLEMALDFLEQQSPSIRRTVILSDLLQTAISDGLLYPYIIESLAKHKVQRLIGIGERISKSLQHLAGKPELDVAIELYPTTEDFLQQFRSSSFREEVILVKGARVFGFEKIVQLLEQKAHQTVLEINLNALVYNLRKFQAKLKPATKVMAMVKAFAYGSGGAEIAGVLQFHKVDYLGVAYADEGVDLRRAGISLPIMVMNPEESSFDAIVDNNLEPEIYSFELLQIFDSYLKKEGIQHYPVHLEVETGMNRLGFAYDEVERLGQFINETNTLKVQSIFSHLAASEESGQDAFTKEQYERFKNAASTLQQILNYPILAHIANSAAIIRHPGMHMDMVRLGIGLYGVDSSGGTRSGLQTVATLKTTVAQIKHIKTGESVSYNRKAIVTRDSVIATVRLGYADGYPRRLGHGVGKMYINGKMAPVIGTVCMDMTMLDITDIPGVEEGDDVIVFGEELKVQQLAEWAGTIPYEIMTGISQRVKRVYFEE